MKIIIYIYHSIIIILTLVRLFLLLFQRMALILQGQANR